MNNHHCTVLMVFLWQVWFESALGRLIGPAAATVHVSWVAAEGAGAVNSAWSVDLFCCFVLWCCSPTQVQLSYLCLSTTAKATSTYSAHSNRKGSSSRSNMPRDLGVRGICQVCHVHYRIASWLVCHCCRRGVNDRCYPENCLAQYGMWDDPERGRNLCKDCFVSMSQAILPLAAVLPDALVIVVRNNAGTNRSRGQTPIELTSESY